MPKTQKPEIVVVTGATAGVGRAVVREFAKQKAWIALLARDEARLATAKQEVEEAGGRALAFPVDVAKADQIEHAAVRVIEQFGVPDIWINNAMATIFSPLHQIEPDEFKRATEVTYLGCVYGTMAALKVMLPQDRGCIVQVGSALAYRSIPFQAAYCGAKHALVGFTDSLRCELIHYKSRVHVTMVHLPALNTPQFSWARTRLPRHPQPIPPIFEPELAARAIYFAAHHRRREIYVAGPTMKAIYGQDLAPGVADWYLGTHGYQDQQTSEPVPANRPDNLFHPVPGDYAAHGAFSDRSKSHSAQNWLDRNRVPAAAVGAGVIGLTAFLLRRNSRSSNFRDEAED